MNKGQLEKKAKEIVGRAITVRKYGNIIHLETIIEQLLQEIEDLKTEIKGRRL